MVISCQELDVVEEDLLVGGLQAGDLQAEGGNDFDYFEIGNFYISLYFLLLWKKIN
tara:strand:- start:12595 stop:12762 length:168 start_codon:yes stop_codon:yes gene_type:complete